ncbi:high-affinity nickel-transport family protein [Mycobacterium xenopi 3993]|nr:high-affinity nickel-transport family protein [Mycobacterium xenopi 3993]
MNDGQRPLAVGFFFSLGHSSVVFGLAVLLAIGSRPSSGPSSRARRGCTITPA